MDCAARRRYFQKMAPLPVFEARPVIIGACPNDLYSAQISSSIAHSHDENCPVD
jgi:hypothetical protein